MVYFQCNWKFYDCSYGIIFGDWNILSKLKSNAWILLIASIWVVKLF